MGLENITNDTKVSRRDALQNIAYGIGAVLGITSLYACGSGGSSDSDSGSSNSGNGNGTTEPTIDHAYIVNQFKANGWDVYDAKTGDLNDILPNENYQFGRDYTEFMNAYNSNTNGIRDILSAENALMPKLLDGSMDNDELFYSTVTTSNKLEITIDSIDLSIGQNGRYAVMKQLNQQDADAFRGM